MVDVAIKRCIPACPRLLVAASPLWRRRS